jgi:hypothetical protein
MAISPETFNQAKDLEPDVLDREDKASVEAALLEWLRMWKNASYIDDEYIWYAGHLVGRSRHDGVDATLQRALGPDSGAQTAIGDFLRGYWRHKPIAPEFDLETFVRALDAFPPEEGAYAATALALYAAVTSDTSGLDQEARRRFRERLLWARQILRAKGIHPGVLVYLDKLPPPRG